MLDDVSGRYLELCRNDVGGLGVAAAGVELPAALDGVRLLDRPLFVEEPALAQAVEDVLALFGVMVELPQRLFGGDVAAYWSAVGGDPGLLPLLRDQGSSARFGRADLYRTEHGFSLLEFNVGGGLGGFELGELPRALLAGKAFARFAARYRLGHVRTGDRVAAALRAVSPRSEPVVALVFAPGKLAHYRRPIAPTVAVLEGQGFKVVLGELGQVREDGGRLLVAGTRVDVVLRFFAVDETAGCEHALEAIACAERAGTAVLWTGLGSTLVTNKGALALVSDPRCEAVLSDRERAARDRVLPWTRMLSAGLVEECAAEREELVLKPCRGFAGTGVVTGWSRTDRQWRDLLLRCAGREFVVQRRVVPRPEPVVDPATGREQDWTAVWGLFVTPDGYGGNAVRAQPASGGGVIGYSTSTDTCATVAFTHPPLDHPAAPASAAASAPRAVVAP